MPLIEPIEKLIQSDFSLALFGRDIKHLKVARGKIGPETPGYHVGPDSGILNFSYSPGRFNRKYPLGDMMTFEELGFVMIALKDGETYAIHRRFETLPKDLEYQEVSKADYLDRFRELDKYK